jgi:NADH:ubiquinone reductase (non-electrogenic)
VTAADNCDVAIFGGGFGGLYTALAVSREAQRKGRNLDVVLVEPTDTFVFLPLLYDLTVGTATEAEVCPSYADLLRGTGVRHVRASLESLQEDTRAELRPTNANSNNNNNTSSKAPDTCTLLFSAAVVAVGASPASILASVPGASTYAQPFYTALDAKKTRRLLNRLEAKMESTATATGSYRPRVAVVGGGFGGVEMAASVQRRLSAQASVTLLSRGRPMAGTRAEPLVDKALRKLGVTVEDVSVEALEQGDDNKVLVRRKKTGSDELVEDDSPWDLVLWTAGSRPSDPVADGCIGLLPSQSGRLAVDPTLRCVWEKEREGAPRVWALGDCAEVVQRKDDSQPVFPKTAQVAMQQAETVASNILAELEVKGRKAPAKAFDYQDLGSMLTLGGPNGAVLAPSDGTFAPIFAPLLDTFGGVLGVADEVLSAFGRSPVIEELGLNPETLGLSLGSHGLGVDDGAAPGTLAGTLTGAARRTVYAVRMPTNQQRAVSLLSATISTAAALAKEASDRNKK